MLALFVLFISAILYFYYKREQSLKSIAKLKGPRGWPLIGNALMMRDRENALEFSIKDTKLYGRTYKLFLGLEPIIFTSDAKLLEMVLGSNKVTKKSIDYTFFKRWWGDGLLTSTGIKWKSHRKILTPAFHYNILEDFVQIFENRGEYLIDNLKKNADKGSFNIFELFTLYTLDVICETSMGTTVDAQTHPNHKYIQAVKEMCDIGNRRIVNPIYRIENLYELTPLYRRELKVVEIIKDFSRNIISKKRNALKNTKEDQEERDEFGKRKKTTFLDILLKSTVDGKPLSDEDVREEVDTFLFEGHDTTAIALSFIAYHLSKHPDVQSKAVAELNSIFGDDKHRKSTIEELQRMKYLELVIKESLRLYPSVAFHARTVLEDIEYNGNVIQKDTTLVINQYALHRHEDVFPDPYKFDPERFHLHNQKQRGPYEYIPFSAGPRNCIGQKFAMLELKSAISKILRNFELVDVPEFKPIVVSLATIVTTNGMSVALKSR